MFRKSVLAILVNEKNKFFLGENSRKNFYKFCQGGIEKRETSINALKREVFEELGIKIKHSQITKSNKKVKYFWSKSSKEGFNKDHPNEYQNYKGQIMEVFKVKINTNKQKIKLDKREFMDYSFISYFEFLNYSDKLSPREKAYDKALSFFNLDTLKLYHKNKLVLENIIATKTTFQKATGLMLKSKRASKNGMFFNFLKDKEVRYGASITMMFCFFPLDIIFIDKKFRVVDKKTMYPFQITYTPKKKCLYVIEAYKGTFRDIKISDKITIV